jgi:hypothetical protein
VKSSIQGALKIMGQKGVQLLLSDAKDEPVEKLDVEMAHEVAALVVDHKTLTDWNNEAIAQFYVTIYFEEHGDTRKFYWMTDGQWYEVSHVQFFGLLGFGRKDTSRARIHMALKLDARRIKFMYPRSK